jgi:hypothetical protein
MMYINLKEIVTDIKADLLRKGISNIYFNIGDYQNFDVTTVHHVIIGSKMYQTLMFSSIYSTDDNLMNHLEKMVNQLSDVRVPIVISILALTRTDKENRLYYTVLYIYE